MRVKPDSVLVHLSEKDRRALFEKPIKQRNGKVVFMTIDDMEEKGFEKSYAQSVSVGKIIAIGKDVTSDIKMGDTVVLDYIVDHMEETVVTGDSKGKIVCLTTKTKYRTEDRIIDANRRTPRPTVDYRKGDLEDAALLIAVIRDGVIHALPPYILLRHIAMVIKYKEQENSPVWSSEEEKEIIQREVMFVHRDSDIAPGTIIFCENEAIFERQLNGQPFDVVFDHDVMAEIIK